MNFNWVRMRQVGKFPQCYGEESGGLIELARGFGEADECSKFSKVSLSNKRPEESLSKEFWWRSLWEGAFRSL